MSHTILLGSLPLTSQEWQHLLAYKSNNILALTIWSSDYLLFHVLGKQLCYKTIFFKGGWSSLNTSKENPLILLTGQQGSFLWIHIHAYNQSEFTCPTTWPKSIKTKKKVSYYVASIVIWLIHLSELHSRDDRVRVTSIKSQQGVWANELVKESIITFSKSLIYILQWFLWSKHSPLSFNRL